MVTVRTALIKNHMAVRRITVRHVQCELRMLIVQERKAEFYVLSLLSTAQSGTRGQSSVGRGETEGGARSHLGSTGHYHQQVGSAALEDGHPESCHDLRRQASSRDGQGQNAKLKKEMSLVSPGIRSSVPTSNGGENRFCTLRHPGSESAT